MVSQLVNNEFSPADSGLNKQLTNIGIAMSSVQEKTTRWPNSLGSSFPRLYIFISL